MAWLDAHIMSNITASVTIEKLRSIFATHGLPDTVVTDNGPTFTSELFQEFIEKNGIRHVRTAPYHPASNGLAERAVETLKDGLRKMSGQTLETKLSRFLFQYRITPHTTTGVSPAEMLMGRKPKSHLDLLHPDVGPRVIRSQEEQKGRRDQHAKERFFKPGDCVFVKNFAQGQPWLPGLISRQTGPVSFTVDLLDGRQIRRHQDHLLAPQQTDGLSVQSESVQVDQPVCTPNLAGSTQPATGPVGPTVGLRRSKRQHKPPDRLTC
uniref:Integrase catalytic domain-containing protein n=1 Tax=Esox lucius TaxID=8010 RepID=A0AAY5K6G3_ESOLU